MEIKPRKKIKMRVIDRPSTEINILGEGRFELARSEEDLHDGHHLATTSPRDQVIKIAGGEAAEPQAAAAARAEADHSPRIGDLVDHRYRLDEKTGEGGVCIVYKAFDELLKMTVAVKALKPEAASDPDFVQTLLEEARTAMQLSHSQIVRLHTLEETAGYYYLVMEHLEGQTLRECLADYDALPAATVAEIVQACYPPLRHAHKRGILHNDIKPDNILLTQNGTVKLLDFGLSCLANQPTRDHALLGTPTYMSPERLRREVLDLRSDIYSFSLTIYELLTGRLPFPEGLKPEAFLEFESVEMPDVPASLRPVLEKGAARERSDRWETLDDFIRAFVEATARIENSP